MAIVLPSATIADSSPIANHAYPFVNPDRQRVGDQDGIVTQKHSVTRHSKSPESRSKSKSKKTKESKGAKGIKKKNGKSKKQIHGSGYWSSQNPTWNSLHSNSSKSASYTTDSAQNNAYMLDPNNPIARLGPERTMDRYKSIAKSMGDKMPVRNLSTPAGLNELKQHVASLGQGRRSKKRASGSRC
jgi:phosphotransferase system IIB component